MNVCRFRSARFALGAFPALTLALATHGRAAAGDGPPETAPSVRVEKVGMIEQAQAKTFIGTVAGSETVAAVARVSGILEDAPFREGGMVKKGDVLFRIEDVVHKAKLSVARAAVKQCEAELAIAEKDHERNANLLKDNAISQSNFDTTFYRVELQKARLEEAKANVVLAEQDVEYTVITAAVGGRIGEKRYSTGNYITPGAGTLATVVCFDPAYVKFPVSEADYFSHFTDHDKLHDSAIEIIRANGEAYSGEITIDMVDNAVDEFTDTIMVRLSCANANYQLLPGGFVQVRLARKYGTPVPAVNVQAVMTDGEKHYVFVVGADDTVERREVTVGDQVYRRQAVPIGLQPGERVVIGGLNKAIPGKKVVPVMEQTRPVPSPVAVPSAPAGTPVPADKPEPQAVEAE